MIDINNLTLGQIKELQAVTAVPTAQSNGLNEMVGKKCIVRTYSAGVWFGTVQQKDGNEVIVTGARRLWRWSTNESISLSSLAVSGIRHEDSKLPMAVESVWLEAIELIPCTPTAIASIESAPIAKRS